MSSQKHIDAIYDNQKLMSHIAGRMERKADAFISTGNDLMGEWLFKIAHQLVESADKLIDSHGSMQDEQLRQSAEHSGNILKAMIAGVELGKKEA